MKKGSKGLLSTAMQHPSMHTSHAARGNNESRTSQVDFTNAREAYKSKTNMELLRAIVVFRLCTIQPLVRNAQKLIKMGEMTVGKRLTNDVLVKRTFFKHFCGGENIDEIQPTLEKLSDVGVGAILDYAAENDVPQDERTNQKQTASIERMDGVLVSRQREDVTSARIYDYHSEKECDENLNTILECIEHASRNKSDGKAFCAVKLTALCKPALLERMSALLMATRRSWVEGFSPQYIERTTPLEEYRKIVSCPTVMKSVNLVQWKNGLARICKTPVSDEEAEKMFHVIKGANGEVDYLDYTRLLTLESLSIVLDGDREIRKPNQLRALTHSGALPLLNKEETMLLDNLVTRINKFAKAAVENKVNVMIDAEQTYLQVAIDHFTLLLQRIYNVQNPRIYNTYQCYLTFMESRIKNDLERGRREGWKFAGKLVRGAYMVQEREIAERKNYASPIMPTLQATHDNFNTCVQIIMEQMPHKDVGLMVGSHNKESIEYIIETMAERGIHKNSGGVYFGQLMGMADQLTLPLGQHGYNAYKYVPYGPVKEVMPYLIRRAQENSSIQEFADKEITMLTKEIRRRVTGV
eukprot:TRINITY_DN3393_c0_g4_i1.p1 TRINITY_DN3393_c0_g4~~TRINITY_DN3393_c0_g4_i1.p1  ORF type:complete len:582 (+),score=116.27 TRINITY_DN3393_c0_g4_i1:55-1800(+)